MKGDFSRLTFDPAKAYTRVLMQQGRVLLDADWNEMVEIQVQEVRADIAQVLGPHAGTADGFKIGIAHDDAGNPRKLDFAYQAGAYFVDGIRSWTNAPALYSSQPGMPALEEDGLYLAYLDVYERHVTWYEDQDPLENAQSILEVALRGPDTTTRTQVAWRIRALPLRAAMAGAPGTLKNDYQKFLTLLSGQGGLRHTNVRLSARAVVSQDAGDPCVVPPESRYRGPENQLYRVEVHRGGVLGESTYKWSRNNAADVFPVEDIDDATVTVRSLGRDEYARLRKGDYVEVSDDRAVARGRSDDLLQVVNVDIDRSRVTLSAAPPPDVARNPLHHGLLRRWNSRGALRFPQFSGDQSAWIGLEDGVEVKFRLPDGGMAARVETGDYWLVPARTATGDVEWPGPRTSPAFLHPHGEQHHYAPLALITTDGDGLVSIKEDVRRIIKQCWT